MATITADQRCAGLVDYKEESNDSDSDEEYVIPQKRIKADRTVKGKEKV